MSIQVSSIEELKEQMMSIVGNAMVRVERSVKDEIKNNIDKTVYEAYTPKQYQRTFKLRDSVEADTEYVNSRKVTTRVYHDVFGNSKKWYSVHTGNEISAIPEIVSYGRYGTFKGVGYDGQYHNINPRATTWGKPRYYMAMATGDYMDIIACQLEIEGYNILVHY